MSNLYETKATPAAKTRFTADSLVVRKATWLVNKEMPWVTAADVADLAIELVTLEGDDDMQLLARDLADFATDVLQQI